MNIKLVLERKGRNLKAVSQESSYLDFENTFSNCNCISWKLQCLKYSSKLSDYNQYKTALMEQNLVKNPAPPSCISNVHLYR